MGHVAHVAGASCVLGVLAEEFPLKSGVIVNLQENPREVFLLQRDDQHPATIGLLGCCIVDSGGLAKVAASCHQTFESKIDVATSPVVVFCEEISQFGEGLQFICQEYGVPTVWLPTIHPNLIEQRQFSYCTTHHELGLMDPVPAGSGDGHKPD